MFKTNRIFGGKMNIHQEIKKLFRSNSQKGKGKGPEGDGGSNFCVCPECGYRIEHKRMGMGKSIPCIKIKCKKCGAYMIGEKEYLRRKKEK